MQIVIADISFLATAVANDALDLLAEQFEHLLLSPAVVDALVEMEMIDELLVGTLAGIISVVSLTEDDEALAVQLAEQIADESGEDPQAHRSVAEAIALMGRSDLGAALLLCDDPSATHVARLRALPVQSFAALIATLHGDAAGAAVRVPQNRDDDEDDNIGTALPLRRDALPTVEIDEETATLLDLLIEEGVAANPSDLVRRAIRGLATALLD